MRKFELDNDNGNGNDIVQTGIILPKSLRDRLRNLAINNKRSLAKQIEWILEHSIDSFENQSESENTISRTEECVT